MPRRRPRRRGGDGPEAFRDQLLARMARAETAEALNDKVITPFVSALETICRDRGYVFNIYGERSNLVFSTEEDAEAIYALVEQYLDEKGHG